MRVDLNKRHESWRLIDNAGVVGPYLIGALKSKYGGYTVPMVIMTGVNVLAVVYFAVLLRFLPAKSSPSSTPWTTTLMC